MSISWKRDLLEYLSCAGKFFAGLLLLSGLSVLLPHAGWAPCTSDSYGYPLPYYTRYCECFRPKTWGWEPVGFIANPILALVLAFPLASVYRMVMRRL